MPTALPPHLTRLLAERDRLASQAAEADAHRLAHADELRARQHQIEELLERALPLGRWRQLFPRWVLADVTAGAQPAHSPGRPQARCSLCQLENPAAAGRR